MYRGEYVDDGPVLSITSNADIISELLSRKENKRYVSLLGIGLPSCFHHHNRLGVTCSALETTAAVPLLAVAYPPDDDFATSCKVVSGRIPVLGTTDVDSIHFSVVDRRCESILKGVSEANLDKITVVFKVESVPLEE